jgi:hypothetical protein
MDYLPEAPYTLMTYRRPLIIDYHRRLLLHMTYRRPLIMDYLPEAAYTLMTYGGR